MEAHQQSDIMIMAKMTSHKGKRTKRRRPSSSRLTLTIASTNTSSSSTSTTTSNETGTTTVEFTDFLQENHTNNDQYIANCLMLLSHGHQIHSPTPLNMVVPPRSNVYECKTCDRGFTSFQALGGHSASHNKPRKDLHDLSKNRTSYLIGTPNNPFSCNIPSGSIKRPKVHECSICGLDFSSGQALGGHMRRHRSMIMTANSTTSTTATTYCNASYGIQEAKKHKTVPPFDLNLPAPKEDDYKEDKTPFGSIKKIIFFSTPSLDDCHF